MCKHLKILFAEDALTDVEIAKWLITKSNISFDYKVVDNEPEFIRELDEFRPDIIISDYSMPQFTGMQALEIRNHRCPDTAFIVLTGSVNEDAAVECMKAGATDYLIKQHNARLPFAIKDAIDQMQVRQEKRSAYQALRDLSSTFAAGTGEEFFQQVCKHLVKTFNIDIAFIGKLVNNGTEVETIIGLAYSSPLTPFKYSLNGTPCENVIGKTLCIYPKSVQELFPDDHLLVEMGVESYAGCPINNRSGEPIGIIVILGAKPLQNLALIESTMNIFVDRVSSEMERVKFEEKLHQAAADWKSTFDAIQAGIALLSTDQKVLRCNQKFLEITGKTMGDVLYNHCYHHVHQTNCPIVTCPLDRTKTSSKREACELTINNSIYELVVDPIFDENNNIVLFVHIITDITAKKAMEKNLLVTSQKLKSHFEHTPVAVIELDNSLIVTQWNLAAEKIFGYSRDEAIGQHCSFIIPPSNKKLIENVLNELIRGGDEKSNINQNVCKDGTIITCEWQNTPLVDEHGTVTGIASIVQDISERLRFENELLAAKNKAEESDRLKSAFLANMSHEIRTPLNGILGFAQVLSDGGHSEEEMVKYANIIANSGNRLLELINNIISISKIEAGIEKINLSVLSPCQVLYDAVNQYLGLARIKSIELRVSVEKEIENIEMPLDGQKLFQVLSNLINNALKFTQEGYVEVGLKQNGAGLVFYVKDTGQGIAMTHIDKVFGRFYQADNSFSRGHEGAGLGLSLCKAMVEMMGGTIGIESIPNEGSTFTFTIPVIENIGYQPAFNGQINQKNILFVNNLKVLIVEDDENSEIVLAKIAKRFSREILFARTGLEAVSLCRKNPDIDLVFMDIKLPVLNGYDATKQIRQFNKDVIIVSQTALAQIGDREKSIQAGCNNYVTKPIKREQIYTLVEKLFAPKTSKP